MEEKTVSNASVEKKTGSTFNLTSIMNTTTLHIVMEIITICGLGIYFNRKISKQQTIIDELVAKLAEHDENIQRHEDILEKIVARLNSDPRVVSKQPVATTQKIPPRNVVEPATEPSLPLNLIADIMGVATGSLSNTTYTHSSPSAASVLPSIEELDSELENELQDLKEEKND